MDHDGFVHDNGDSENLAMPFCGANSFMRLNNVEQKQINDQPCVFHCHQPCVTLF